MSETLVAEKEERPVLHHRPADVGAELILREGRPLDMGAVVEEGIGVEDFVAQEVIGAAMKGIASGLGCEVYHAAREAPKFCAKVVGLNPELLDGVLRRDQRRQVDVADVHRAAVNEGSALVRGAPADLVVAPGKDVSPGRILHGLALRHHARHERHEVEHVAPIERHLLDFARVNDLAQRGRV